MLCEPHYSLIQQRGEDSKMVRQELKTSCHVSLLP